MSSNKPEWVPDGGSGTYATRIMAGVKDEHDGISLSSLRQPEGIKKRSLSVDEYVEGVLSGNRVMLSQAITLVESNATKHFDLGQGVIQRLLPYTGNSVRIGVTGVPGAGKSTFIEALGTRLCGKGVKVAVLAIDPSSTVTKGSILGDKTRMEKLAKEPNAYIRPSPSKGTLGGLTRKSRETMLLCEAAGYDVILVETVGVGQSETTVRSMVDFFLFLVITGAGDELQGMKKGVMELADAIIVNKADGNNRIKAEATRTDYDRILHYIRPATEGWATRAYTCSSTEGAGIEEIWDVIGQFIQNVRKSGLFDERRKHQTLSWVYGMVEEQLRSSFYDNPAVAASRNDIESKVLKGELSATQAAQSLLAAYTPHLF